jgi:membrane dipeptidase
MNQIDRRRFLTLVSTAAAAPIAAIAQAQTWPAQSKKTRAAARTNWIIINALGDLEDPNPQPSVTALTSSHPTPDSNPAAFGERVLREAHASGLTAVNVTLGYQAGEMEPFEYTIREIAQMDQTIRRNAHDLLKIQSADDISRAKAEGKIGVIYGFQNASMVGTDATRVDLFGNLGVRVIQLTYNPANQIGDGSMAPENRGLTPFGRTVIERLNANRIMVDLSHSGQNTCLDAARTSSQPVSINHTGCRALNNLPRNKSDEELRLVASKGGFVGVYFMPFLSASGHSTADDVVAHIDHAVNVCGQDHVGIGTDGSVTSVDDLEAYKMSIAKEVAARQAAGVSATGERADVFPFVLNLRGVNQFYDLAARLQKRGYTMTQIEKILGLNFLRYAKAVWGT